MAINSAGVPSSSILLPPIFLEKAIVPFIDLTTSNQTFENMAITKSYSRSDLRRPQRGTKNIEDFQAIIKSASKMIALGAYPTANKMGFSFSKIDDGVKHWISSLPDSQNPLIDLGSGHGFQTLAAIKAGRNVISVDCCEKNLRTLRLHVNKEMTMTNRTFGRNSGMLVDTVLATLPEKHLFPAESASGILLSEVIHFVPQEHVLSIFSHVRHWLEKGGLLVVSTASPVLYPLLLKSLNRTVSEEELSSKWEFVKNATDEELINCPVFAKEIGQVKGLNVPSVGSAQLRSTDELLALANISGFEVLLLDYISAEKYPFATGNDDISLLVARKSE